MSESLRERIEVSMFNLELDLERFFVLALKIEESCLFVATDVFVGLFKSGEDRNRAGFRNLAGSRRTRPETEF